MRVLGTLEGLHMFMCRGQCLVEGECDALSQLYLISTDVCWGRDSWIDMRHILWVLS
jgi:hypothetical protein